MTSSEPATLRALAAQSWAFRWQVEREAALRFAGFAERLRTVGAPGVLVDLASRAAEDEARHTDLCAELATTFGAVLDAGPVTVPAIAPPELDRLDGLTYEVVAACCIAETESTGTLTTLLAGEAEPRVHAVLRAIAQDEVQHARLGWAHLAWIGERRELEFLGPLIPAMLSPGRALFRPADDPALESDGLPRWGVLPHAQKRAVFTAVLREVIFPGLEHVRVDAQPARAWLEARLAEVAASAG